MRSLITGMGFAGYHLAEYLINEKGHEVLGLSIVEPFDIPGDDSFKFQICDVTDFTHISGIIRDFVPDNIFHLAAQSSVARSWQEARATLDTNIYGLYNVLQAVNDQKADANVHIACSSDEYGKVTPDELPLTETSSLRPCSPYALSKVFQDYVGVFFAESRGLKVFRTRAFNHTGPGQAPTFVCSDFAMQIAKIELNLQEPLIKVGNLEARRDFTDVRDVVAAYWAVIEKGESGQIYNICSGNSWAISEILDYLTEMAKMDIKIERDPEKDRPSDIEELRGDYSRLREATDWSPKIDIKKTLEDVLEYWRKTLSSRG